MSTRAAWCRAIGQLRREHASIQGLARQLSTTWKTVQRSVEPPLVAMAADPSRFDDVTALGVDEHVWHHVSTKPVEDGGRGPKELTGMVDLTRDQHGRPGPAARPGPRPLRAGLPSRLNASGRGFIEPGRGRDPGPVPRLQERHRRPA